MTHPCLARDSPRDLAQALYARADLVLLDDPLSAVDPHVAKHLFHKAINGLARANGAAVVLVTHHPHFRQFATKVLVLGHGGTVLRHSDGTAVGQAGSDVIGTAKAVDNAAAEADQAAGSGVAAPVATVAAMQAATDTVHALHLQTLAPLPASAAVTGKGDAAVEPGLAKGGPLLATPKAVTALVLPEDRVLGRVTGTTYADYVRNGGRTTPRTSTSFTILEPFLADLSAPCRGLCAAWCSLPCLLPIGC